MNLPKKHIESNETQARLIQELKLFKTKTPKRPRHISSYIGFPFSDSDKSLFSNNLCGQTRWGLCWHYIETLNCWTLKYHHRGNINKPAALAAVANTFQCYSTNRQKPFIQINHFKC